MDKPVATIETRTLLAMSYILDEYESLKNAVMELEKRSGNSDYVYAVLKITQGKYVIGNKPAKEFVRDYQEVIDKINKYGYISNFIMSNFCWGKEHELNAEYFYEYLQANRENIEIIREVLKKLVELKFEKISLDTGINFSEKKYHLSTNMYHSLHFPYVANAINIPNYQTCSVQFYSETTPYEMTFTTSLGKITEYGRTITCNSLVFDPNLIPNEITQETVFDSLINLKNENKKEQTAIRNAVDLSIGIEDLQYMIESTMRMIDTIDDETIKLNLLKSATTMLEELGKMKVESDALESQIKQTHPSIDEQKLVLEKNLYKQRRAYAAIDSC